MQSTALNIHLYPSNFANESRIEKQTRSLEKLGIFDAIHAVGFGTSNSGQQNGPDNGTSTPHTQWELSHTISVMLFGPKDKGTGLKQKALSFYAWYKTVYGYYSKQPLKCINVHSLPCLPLGVALKAKTGSKLVYDTHELETETNGSKGIQKVLAKVLERALIRFADHVFVVGESIADYYAQAYGIERPTTVLNAPPRRNLQAKTNLLRENLGITAEQRIFLYQGIIGQGRGIEQLLSAFQARATDNAVLVLMGYGPMVEQLETLAAASSTVFYHPAVPPDEVLQHTSAADIGFALIENTCLSYYYCMPNKLFEYGMAGLPCIVSNMKEMKAYVEQHECGHVVDTLNDESINAAVDKALSGNLAQLGQAAHNAARQFSWEVQEKKMHQVYTAMFPRGDAL